MKQFKKLSLLLALVMVFSSFSAGFANSTTEFPKASIADEAKVYLGSGIEEVTVIIELKAEPVIKMAIDKGITYSELSASDVKKQNDKIINQQENLVNDLKKSGIELNAERKYTTVINGFSAKVKVSDLAAIEANPAVKKVRIAKEYYLPEPDMASSTGQVMAPETWNLGYKGQGMVVAVIDSGVDHTHKDFNLTTGTAVALDKNAIAGIIAAQDLNAERLAAEVNPARTAAGKPAVVVSADNCYKSLKVPFAFDYADIDTTAKADTTLPRASEHGQHVSGTVAANGAIKGVAPEAQVLGLKVFSDGSLDSSEPITTSDDVLINAIDDAVKLRANVINMSLGATAGFTLPDDPEQVAIKNARNAGIVVTISAGNSARFNDYSNKLASGYPYPFANNTDTGLLGSPSATSESLSVANMENKSIYTSALKASNGQQFPYSNTAPERPIFAVTPNAPIEFVFCGLGRETDFTGKNVKGKVALIERGSIDFLVKIRNAQTNEAAAVVIFNSEAGGNAILNMGIDETVTIPAVFVGRNVGLLLNQLPTKTVFFPSDLQLLPNPVGYFMDDSTSWGPTPNLEFKPEITAPGGNIYSTVNDDKYEVMSGTSMAAPHVAGASAIMLQKINSDARFNGMTVKDKAIFAKNLLMSTAMPSLIPGTTDYFSPRRSGAGLMNLEAAVKTNAYLYSTQGHTDKQSKVTLREIKDKKATFVVTLDNFGADEKSFYLSGTAQTDRFLNDGAYKNVWNDGQPTNIPNAKLEVALNGNVVLGQVNNTSGAAVGFVPSAGADTKFDILTTKFTNTSSSAVKVTVGGGKTIDLTFTLDLTNSAFASDFFGSLDFFAEGFINFIATDITKNVDLSIPYMGYNGDWNKQSILDPSNYDKESFSQFNRSSLLGLYQEEGEWTGDYLGYTKESGKVNHVGKYAAFSPNGDGYLDLLSPILTFNRNAKSVNIAIYDSESKRLGYVSLNDEKNMYMRKHFSRNGKFNPFLIPLPGSYYENMIWDGKINGNKVKDGQYYYVVESTLDFPGAETQFMFMPVYVDTVAPVINSAKATTTNGKKILEVGVTENHYMNYVMITDIFGKPIKDKSNQAVGPVYYYQLASFDLNALSHTTIQIVAVDFAGNESQPIRVPLTDAPAVQNPQVPSTPVAPVAPVVVPPTTTPVVTPVTPVAGQPVASNQVTVKVEGPKATVEVTAAGITEAAKQGAVVVVEVPKDAQGKAVEVSIPADVMKELAKEGKTVVIQNGGVAFALEGGFANTGDAKNIVVKMETTTPDYSNAGDKQALGVAYELDITNGTAKITNFDKKPEVTITLPAGTTNPQNIGTYVQNTDGSWAFVMTYYNAEKGTVSFKAPHFSKYALMRYNKTFADIKGHWAKNTIEEMASLHITKGVTETQFAPGKNVTRAEFITWILRALGEEAGGTKFPSDVNAKDWYAPYLAKAMSIGLIEEGKFRPTDEITREEMAMYITKGHALLNKITPKFNAEYDMFKDVDKNSPNAKYINYLAENKIVNGYSDKTFKPQNKAIRAEAMTMIKNMLFLKK